MCIGALTDIDHVQAIAFLFTKLGFTGVKVTFEPLPEHALESGRVKMAGVASQTGHNYFRVVTSLGELGVFFERSARMATLDLTGTGVDGRALLRGNLPEPPPPIGETPAQMRARLSPRAYDVARIPFDAESVARIGFAWALRELGETKWKLGQAEMALAHAETEAFRKR